MPRVNDPYWGVIWYPEPSGYLDTQRLANGDLLITETGTVIPFGASCPPGTTPTNPLDSRHPRCIRMDGARNVLYECGGLLAPLGVAGCETERPDPITIKRTGGGGCSPFGYTGGCAGRPRECPPCRDNGGGGGRLNETKESDFSVDAYGRCPSLGEQLADWLKRNWWWLLLLVGMFAFLREQRKKKKGQ